MKHFKTPKLVIISFLCLSLLVPIFAQCPSGTTGYNCQSCPDGCDNCDTDPTTCDTCSTGYYIDSSSVCNECPSNCLECETPYECTKCKPGYDTTTDSDGYQACQFVWWKWFLIIFGILIGCFLIGLLIWCVRQKLKEEDKKDQEIQYEMKLQNTQPEIK